MNYKNFDYEQTEFSRSLLAGVFAGIAATFFSLLYDSYFRFFTGFTFSEMINVSTIIFALLLIVTLAGVIFYFFHHYLKKGTLIYQLVSLVFTIVLVILALHAQRSVDPVTSAHFRELLTGVIGITGTCTIFVIPFLFNKDYV